jgi:U2 small nuclear ribonucleoprotein A'
MKVVWFGSDRLCQILNIKSRTFDAGAVDTPMGGSSDATGNGVRVKLTGKEKERIMQLIRNAKTMAEITRLEKELHEGKIPGGVDVDMEG